MARPRLLGVLLCYNDGDLLAESIAYLLNNHHETIVWDHGSTDETAEVIRSFRRDLLETRFVPRSFDFYELYPAMSRHLLDNYVRRYDWISWPDQDEFLEGPRRDRAYYSYLEEVYESRWDWILFDKFNYWFTEEDDPAVRETTARVRRYSIFPDAPPSIRSWRASRTNIRVFNHNPPKGRPCAAHFRLRHYPMRSPEQMRNRLFRDRAGLMRGPSNFHYENMKLHLEQLQMRAAQLHFDDGVSELDPSPIFDWRSLWGYGPPPAK